MENVTYFVPCRLQICSVYRPNSGKRNIFHALGTADMLCEAPELWKTYHISCFGSCRYTLWKRLNSGKRNIFHALQAADMLCEPPELWKTWHISCVGCCRYALRSARTMENVTYFTPWTLLDNLNTTKHDKTTQELRGTFVLLEPGTFFHEHIDFVSYFLVPNNSLQNTHKNVRPGYSRRPPVFLHFAR